MSDSDAPHPAPSRYRVALRRWSLLAILVGALGVVASEVAGGAWPVTFVTPLARQLAAILALGAIGLLILRLSRREPARRGEAVWLGVAALFGAYATLVAIGVVAWRDVPTLPHVRAADANLGRIKVLSANVHSTNLDRESLVALIARERPDVIVLMELTETWLDALKPLDAEYPVRERVADDAGNFGIGVWSRLPGSARLVVRQHLAEPSLLDVVHAQMTLTLEGNAIRVYGVHPLPPLTPTMKNARDALLRSIADEIATSDVPTIVAGDLNATRYCRIMRDVSRRAGLRDAMPDVGTSWPMTLARPILGIRIDQILGDNAWRVVENHAGPTIGSDHLPMVATLQLTRGTR